MRVLVSLILSSLLMVSSAFAAPQSTSMSQSGGGSENSREFIMACTYGVLAGALVGAASLAFTKQPGENIGRVARGASLGLYTGILLGLYVVYIVPGLEEGAEEDPVAHFPFMILPTFASANSRSGGERLQLDGVKADWTVYHF